MPRYFFHLRTRSGLDEDEFGVDLPDLDSAREEGIKALTGFLRDSMLTGDGLPGQGFEVVDQEGTPQFTMPFDMVPRERPSP